MRCPRYCLVNHVFVRALGLLRLPFFAFKNTLSIGSECLCGHIFRFGFTPYDPFLVVLKVIEALLLVFWALCAGAGRRPARDAISPGASSPSTRWSRAHERRNPRALPRRRWRSVGGSGMGSRSAGTWPHISKRVLETAAQVMLAARIAAAASLDSGCADGEDRRHFPDAGSNTAWYILPASSSNL